jgi:PAS domain S-box-containing protein
MTNTTNQPDFQRQIKELKQQIANLQIALEASEQNFRTLTDSAPVGIYLDDAQGKAIYINKKCAELVGVTAEHALDFNWANFLHPDDRERVFSEWQKSFENNTDFHLEYRYVHADGKVIWTLGEVVPILGDDGNATMFVGTLTDITARKQAEKEKQALEVQLAQAQKMESIGRLAGGIAHDYNNMLNVIMNYAELAMVEVDQSSSVYEKLREILKAATRSAEITHQLLSFARKQVVLPEIFDLNDAVRNMFNMLRHLIGEDIELVWLPQDGRNPIKMDPAQLDHIVVNLCINARDAIQNAGKMTDLGKITIETATVTFVEADCAEKTEKTPGRYVILSVRDNGSGMNKEILENIFEPFFTTKAQDSGTGLGLASVYGTVKQNNGFIDVQSEVDMGSIFKIHLPFYQGQLSGDNAIETLPIAKGSGETILIVEDESSILEVVTMILEDLDYKVLSANSASEALNLVQRYNEKIDLLITDVVMPGMNGRDLVNHMRSNQPNLICLYMSGYTANMITNQAGLEENVNFIQKPFKIEDLIAKVHESLNTI